MKLVILDRDGVINIDSAQFIKNPAEWKPIPGSLEAIARLNHMGYRVVIASNQSGAGRGLFDMAALNAINDKMYRALSHLGGRIDALSLKELRDDRRPVFAGGVAVLSGVFEALGIEHMTISDMALREGLMYDLVGRLSHEDVRASTVRALAVRHGVDTDQAQRVGDTATACLAQVAEAWDLGGEDEQDTLRWAADLHEIGLAVSHNEYHKHGAYLVQNADMAGFSRQEQVWIAALVRGHRRKFPAQVLDGLPQPYATQARRLCVEEADLKLPRIVALDAKTKSVTIRYDFSEEEQLRDWQERAPFPVIREKGQGVKWFDEMVEVQGSTGIRHIGAWKGDVTVRATIVPDAEKDMGGILHPADDAEDIATFTLLESYFHAWDGKSGGQNSIIKFGKQWREAGSTKDFIGFRYIAQRPPTTPLVVGRPVSLVFGLNRGRLEMTSGDAELKGKDLEGFLRFRNDELGDIGRMERQQLVIREVFRKLAQPSVVTRLPELLRIAGNDISTDLSPLELGNLISKLGNTRLSTDRLAGRLYWHDDLSYWMPDLNTDDLDAAVRTVAGTARSMGIETEGVN